VLEALRLLAVDQPVPIAIDDVQWLDLASGRALGFALRRLDTVPVNLLVARRGTDGPLPLGIEELAPAVRQDRMVVGPMDATDLTALLEHRFGGPLPRGLVSRVLAVVAGNPLYAVELTAALRRPVGGPAPVPQRLDGFLADRMGQLPARAAEPLAAVASLAAPTVTLVADALGTAALAGLDDAIDADVLHIDQGRLRFTHPLLGVAALARLRPSTRLALHARLAAVSTDAEERAHHLVQPADGRPDTALAAAVEQGAGLSRARGAPEVAAELAEAAVQLTPPEDEASRCRRLVAVGYYRATAGEIDAACAHLTAALDRAPAGPARTDLPWRLGMLTALAGDTAAGVGLLETALAESGADPELRGTVTRKLADAYGMQGRLAESLHHQRLALEYAEATGDLVGQTDALLGILQVVVITGDDLPPGLLDRIDQLVPAAGPRAPHEDPDLILALADLWRGDLRTATSRLERLHRQALEHGDELGAAWAASLHGRQYRDLLLPLVRVVDRRQGGVQNVIEQFRQLPSCAVDGLVKVDVCGTGRGWHVGKTERVGLHPGVSVTAVVERGAALLRGFWEGGP
jgi:tetratricopeptide (TPR) repeat protein